ncbi:MAG: hypothetical protein NUW01_12950 [Gemmatimonadaceae bacterium]|nr:hypothetical protein [Gemmatimonadaceae bacterium]
MNAAQRRTHFARASTCNRLARERSPETTEEKAEMADTDDQNNNDDTGDADNEADKDASADTGKDGNTFDAARAQALIDKLRDEVKTHKAAAKKAEELEARLNEITEKDKTDAEKLADRAAKAEAKVAAAEQKLRKANLLVELSRPEHGLVSAQAAAKLLEGVEYDDDGAPSNLAELLPEFLESNAFLKGEPAKPKPAGDLNAGSGTGEGKKPSLTAAELEWAAKTGLTPEEYEQAKNISTIDDWEKARKTQAA